MRRSGQREERRWGARMCSGSTADLGRGCERETNERGKGVAVLFVACQQLLETSFPSMCESYLAGMLGPYQVWRNERGGGAPQEKQPGLRSQSVCGSSNPSTLSAL